MNDAIKRIEASNLQRQYCLDVLKLWASAKGGGYSPEDVASFTFVDAFITPEQKRENIKTLRCSCRQWPANAPHNGIHYINAVRLLDGTLKPITITKRPCPIQHQIYEESKNE